MRKVLWPEPGEPGQFEGNVQSMCRVLSMFVRACSATGHSERTLEFLSVKLQESDEFCDLDMKLREYLHEQGVSPAERDSDPQEALTRVICFTKKMELELRQAVNLSAFCRVRAKDAEIRRAHAELRSLISTRSHTNFSSKEEEGKLEYLEFLLGQQRQEFKVEHAEGMDRAKEKVDDEKRRSAVFGKAYDAAAEEQEQQMLERLLREQLAAASSQTFDLERQLEQVKIAQREGVPELEEMIRLQKAKELLLQQHLAGLKKTEQDLEENRKSLEKERSDLEKKTGITQQKLFAFYEQEARLRQELKDELENEARLKRQKEQDVEERWKKLGEEVYEQVGGAMNQDGNIAGYTRGDQTIRPHKNCEDRAREWQSAREWKGSGPPCDYLSAVQDGTAFVVHKMKNMKKGNHDRGNHDRGFSAVQTLDLRVVSDGPQRRFTEELRMLKENLITYLRDGEPVDGLKPTRAFAHSVDLHNEDLKRIVGMVVQAFDRIKWEVDQAERKYDDLLRTSDSKINKLLGDIATKTEEIRKLEITFNEFGRQETKKLLEDFYREKDLKTNAESLKVTENQLEHCESSLGHFRSTKEARKEKIDELQALAASGGIW